MIDRERLQDLNAIVREHQDAVFRFCAERIGETLAIDVTQEVFIAAWKNLPQFHELSSMRTWLLGIAKNKCGHEYRNRTKREELTHTWRVSIRHYTQRHDPIGEPGQTASDEMAWGQLTKNITELKSDEQILIRLRFDKDLSIKDIADLVGGSVGTVSKRLQRIIERLRASMKNDTEE